MISRRVRYGAIRRLCVKEVDPVAAKAARSALEDHAFVDVHHPIVVADAAHAIARGEGVGVAQHLIVDEQRLVLVVESDPGLVARFERPPGPPGKYASESRQARRSRSLLARQRIS
jgi:hypothetical protein